MAFCSNCGNKIPDGAKFCMSCGTPVVIMPAPAAPVAPAPAAPVAAEPVVTQPETVAVPEPEPIPEVVPEPVQPQVQAVASTYPPGTMIGLNVEEPDMESGEEPEPIVGTYVIPGMGGMVQQAPVQPQVQQAPVQPQVQQAAVQQAVAQPQMQQAAVQPQIQQAAAQPQMQRNVQPQMQAMGPQKKKVWPIVLAIVGGGLTLLIVAIVAVVLIVKSNTASAPQGEGTALVDLLDDAAYNRQMMNE